MTLRLAHAVTSPGWMHQPGGRIEHVLHVGKAQPLEQAARGEILRMMACHEHGDSQCVKGKADGRLGGLGGKSHAPERRPQVNAELERSLHRRVGPCREAAASDVRSTVEQEDGPVLHPRVRWPNSILPGPGVSGDPLGLAKRAPPKSNRGGTPGASAPQKRHRRPKGGKGSSGAVSPGEREKPPKRAKILGTFGGGKNFL